MKIRDRIIEHPPRYFAPVCIRTPLGFLGGPSGYCEVGESERGRGPIVVEESGGEQQPEEIHDSKATR